MRTVYTHSLPNATVDGGRWRYYSGAHGREARAYLEHIVQQYDSLADRTVFMQASEPACGYFLNPPRLPYGGHLTGGVSALDYMTAPLSPEGVYMPLTVRHDFERRVSSVRSAYADLPPAERQRVGLPSRPVGPLVPAATVADHWLPWERADLLDHLRRHQEKGGEQMMSFASFWERILRRPRPPVLFFAQGAQFAASRDALRRVPRET